MEPVSEDDEPATELRSRRQMELPGEELAGDAQLQKAFDFLTNRMAEKEKAAQAGPQE